jgi:hypothetical protein
MPGGNWHYTEQIPLPAHYSYVPTEVADYVPDLPPKSVELPYEEEYDNEPLSGLTYEQRLQEHRGPKPIWESLYSNAPAVSTLKIQARYILIEVVFEISLFNRFVPQHKNLLLP